MDKNIFNDAQSLFEKAFDMQSGVVYYPVRHHSPACSFHLEKTIEEYKPDVILIEGPSDADDLIPYLVHEDTVPPVCIYYSYDDKKGIIDDSKEKYRAYYPFLEYSPEMYALKLASKNGIEAHFIDIPYADMLVNEEKQKLQFDFGKDDYENEISYTRKIAEDNNCRNYAEFWESRFETSAFSKDTRDFVRGVMAVGFYLRQCGHNDENEYLKNAQREKYMADNIMSYSSDGRKILVIAGAYHIQGLISSETKLPKMKKSDKASKSLYLMPYNFFEADSSSGYGAGIPFPSFYQKIWEKIHSEKFNPDNVYEETVLEFIVKTARYTRTKHPVSVPDEVNALTMAKSLAMLRDRHSAGVYELIDGVRSTFVKGDITTTASFELDFLFRQLTGMKAGSIVNDEKIVPPVVEEFHNLCKKYRIKTNSIAYQDITLETVKKPQHYEKSCFLHRLEFLNTGFCKMTAGADYVNNKDKNLIREQWRCRYSTSVETSLIDLSVFGGSILQICKSVVDSDLNANMTAQELGKIMMHIHVMGMNELYHEKEDIIHSVILSDSDFISVCSFIRSVKSLAVMNKLRNGEVPENLNEFISMAYEKALRLIESIKNADDDKQDDVCKCIVMLYSISLEYPELCSSDILCNELEEMTKDISCRSEIYGVSSTILFKCGMTDTDNYCTAINSFLETSEGDESAMFLCGVFMAGRDILFTDKKLLSQIDKIISSMDYDEFMAVLPNLRYAFTNFIPVETQRISKMVADSYNTDVENLAGSYVYSREETIKAMDVDRKAVENLRKWGLY